MIAGLALAGLLGCSESYSFNDFKALDANKTPDAFAKDSAQCEKEKNKHSNKIQGREFGFKGKDTGYLGCMKLKGWVPTDFSEETVSKANQ